MTTVEMTVVFLLLLLALRVSLKYFKEKGSPSNHPSSPSQQVKNSPTAPHIVKGRQGEEEIYQDLLKLEGYFKILRNLYFIKENGDITEMDLLLLHPSGIYVFESKNYSGWIFGSEYQKKWTQTLSKGRGGVSKQSFFNPIIQNKVHIKALQYYLAENCPDVYSYIVFGNRASLKQISLKSNQHQVIKREDLLHSLSMQIEAAKTRGRLLTPQEIDRLYRSLRPLTQRPEKLKQEHIQQVRTKVKSEEYRKLEPIEPISPLEKPISKEEIAQAQSTPATPPQMKSELDSSSQTPVLEKSDQIDKEIREEENPAPPAEEKPEVPDLVALLKASLEQEEAFEREQARQQAQQEEENKEGQERNCPRCQGQLILRTANKGAKAGQQFLGCSNFPKCWYKEDLPVQD
ncbi:NERD domain-containing protein [Streptococcus oricebi]|uniref:NERD domain-containing protein n=1 Tax=Streptococcus oricebi TaxID=1547447 RepID=A0ABS5B4M5_9STRE|nr:NERD domain-containing protein [Streptococcus oricebi]MBP2623705.1 hypothetical protein [Streptococcus oricebi]